MILINFLLQVAILRQQLAAARAEATALRRVLRERELGPGVAGAGGGAAVAAAALEQAQTCVSAAQIEAARLRMQLVSLPGRVSWFASCLDLAGRPAVLKPKGAKARDVASFSRERQRRRSTDASLSSSHCRSAGSCRRRRGRRRGSQNSGRRRRRPARNSCRPRCETWRSVMARTQMPRCRPPARCIPADQYLCMQCECIAEAMRVWKINVDPDASRPSETHTHA